ncbi:MAG: polyisoprenoid-binding protein [Gammaproteobacteria bacterium]|nr:polyisoprenoid-binding protein [Gammaproteobacteria bacterium]
MFARLAAVTTIGLIAGTAFAAPETYTIDSQHTFPSFEINHFGFSTQRGRFNSTSGRLTLDREAKKAAAEITIDTASIDTGLADLEAHLRKPDFFDVEKYPTITFKSTGAHFNGDRLTGLDGQLTMHGQTKPVALAINKLRCGPHPKSKKTVCGAEASATLKRSDFGISYGVPMVGDKVKLLIQVEAQKD